MTFVNTNELTAEHWVRLTRKVDCMADDIGRMKNEEVANEHCQTAIHDELQEIYIGLRACASMYRKRALNELKRIGKQAPLF